MNIDVLPLPDSSAKPLFKNILDVPFGSLFTDRMLIAEYDRDKGWHSARIQPIEELKLHPGALVLHYGQEIFEGLKAFSGKDDKIILFRPEMNIKRFNKSAQRMCMPALDEDFVLNGLKSLINLEKRWVPKQRGASLYIRPTMIATEVGLGVRASNKYLFYVILSPVGPYYKEGFNPIGLYVTKDYIRAAYGGVGEAKTGGNYAASLFAGEVANKKGYSQVLWLDAKERKYVEEVGAMNIFFAFGDTIITSPLTGSILAGITRDSVLKIAKDLGLKAVEKQLTIDEVINGIEKKEITEIFGTGTAASISPVGHLAYNDKKYIVNEGKVGEVSKKLYNYLLDLQYGEAEDRYNWITTI